jgi:hypothetical protein
MKLNETAYKHAQRLIKDGKTVVDERDARFPTAISRRRTDAPCWPPSHAQGSTSIRTSSARPTNYTR